MEDDNKFSASYLKRKSTERLEGYHKSAREDVKNKHKKLKSITALKSSANELVEEEEYKEDLESESGNFLKLTLYKLIKICY